MAFTAKKTDNSIAAVVNDFESTIVGGLELLGYGYVNYSEEIANNFVRIAENFANITPPDAPLRGQLWWDTSTPGQPALWVCSNPAGAATPVTERWSQIFQVGADNSVSLTLDQLTDVNTVGAVSGEVLQYNGSEWISGPAGVSTLDGLSDVNTAGASNGEFLKFDGTNWVPDTVNLVTSLDSLSDVSTAGAINGSVLKFNGSSWVVGTDLSGGGSGSVEWGNITGTLSTQTDLTNALNARAPLSHTHIIGDVTGLQSALDGKLSLASLLTVDGAGSGIDSDLLDGQHGSYYLNLNNHTGSIPDSAITSGSSFTSTGWVKVGSLYLMWGLATIPQTPSLLNVNVTFPITFPNAVMHVYITDRSNFNSGGDNEDEDKWIAAFSTSGATIGVFGDRGQTNYISWLAVGH